VLHSERLAEDRLDAVRFGADQRDAVQRDGGERGASGRDARLHQPRLLARAVGALTAALGAVGAAALSVAAKPEEGDGGE